MAEEKQDNVYNGEKPDIAINSSKNFFISYNSADKGWAEWIAWQLEDAGFSTILQSWDFRPGANFALMMQNATRDAERTIAVLSTNYLKAVYTQPEWAAAFKQDPQGTNGLLVPVMVHDCKKELTGLWSQIVYINVVGLNEQKARTVLLEGIARGRNKPKTPPTFPGIMQHNGTEEPNFPGNVTSEKSRSTEMLNTVSAKTDLPRPRLNKPFNPYKTREEWIEYITSNLQEVIEGDDSLDLYVDNAQGYRQLRILYNGNTVYSLDIYKDSMGGSRKDEGISFSYTEGRATFSSGFHASGSFKWDIQKEVVVLDLLDMSLLSHSGVTKEYTKEEFLHALWDKILSVIERSAS